VPEPAHQQQADFRILPTTPSQELLLLATHLPGVTGPVSTTSGPTPGPSHAGYVGLLLGMADARDDVEECLQVGRAAAATGPHGCGRGGLPACGLSTLGAGATACHSPRLLHSTPHTVQGDASAVAELACLMYLASTEDYSSSSSSSSSGSSSSSSSADWGAASMAAVSARLRWPQLLQAVCEEVGAL